MRVLLISHTCQSRTEGQPKARCLAKIPGIELRVVTPDRWMHYGSWRRSDIASESDFYQIDSKVSLPWVSKAQFYLHWYPQLKSILQEFRPDVIDLWEEPWGLVSAQACSLRGKILPNCKIVSETEQNINKSLPFPFEKFRSYTLSKADFAVGRNGEAVSILREKGYRGPSEIVPNAVDTALFRPLDRTECRSKLGLTGFTAGYIGRIVEEKGLGDMVDALAHCPPDVNLLFVGSGVYQPALLAKIEAARLQKRVTVLPNLPLEELPEVMNAIDVLVLPSRTTASWKEQFGRVIIEAHACGTPVIGSSSGAIPEVIGNGGIVFPEGDAEALSAALLRMKSDCASVTTMKQAGYEAVVNQFTWQKVAERMAAIYEKVTQTNLSSYQTGI